MKRMPGILAFLPIFQPALFTKPHHSSLLTKPVPLPLPHPTIWGIFLWWENRFIKSPTHYKERVVEMSYFRETLQVAECNSWGCHYKRTWHRSAWRWVCSQMVHWNNNKDSNNNNNDNDDTLRVGTDALLSDQGPGAQGVDRFQENKSLIFKKHASWLLNFSHPAVASCNGTYCAPCSLTSPYKMSSNRLQKALLWRHPAGFSALERRTRRGRHPAAQ